MNSSDCAHFDGLYEYEKTKERDMEDRIEWY